jgi:predicted transcriptional regulator
MPEEFSIDQLVEKLVFMNKVEKGMKQSELGNVNTKEQARNKLSKWLR